MEVRINLHRKQREIYKAWENGERLIVVAAGRQVGKTQLALCICLIALLRGWKTRLFWVSRSHGQAADAFVRLKRMLDKFPKGYYKAINSAPYSITLKNGSAIEFRSAKDPDAIRGFTDVHGIVIDEAAFVKEEVFTTAKPIIAKTKGWALLISSPDKPEDWFHRVFKKAKSSFHMTSLDNPLFPREEIDELEATMRSVDFRREILAEFVQAEGALIRQEWIKKARKEKDKIILEDGSTHNLSSLSIFTAADTAISTSDTADWTAIVTIGITPSNQVIVLDARRDHWTLNEQLEQLEGVNATHEPRKIGVEYAGAGIALLQEISRTKRWKRKVEDIKPLRSKADRFVRTALAAEKGELFLLDTLPAWYESDIISFTGTKADESDDVADATAHAVNLALPDRNKAWTPDEAGFDVFI